MIKKGMMVLGLVLLASCTEQENTSTDGVIRLGVSQTMNTRAAINDLAALSGEGTKVGVYGVKTTTETAATPLGSQWGAGMLMQNVQTTAIAQEGAISWADTYKYPKAGEAEQHVKFCLYYPYAAEKATPAGEEDYVTAATANAAPVLHFTTDGTKDVMYTRPMTGTRLKPASEVTFDHALTQLSFELVDEEGLFTYPITEVKLTGVNTRAEMDIETGTLANWGTPGELVLSSASVTLSQGVTKKLDKVVMLQPKVASFSLEVIYTDETSKTKTATVEPEGDDTFAPGKAYTITIHFKGSLPIRLTAKLTPWQEGGKGNGYIE